MHLTTALDELAEAELLDHAESVARTQRECEAQVLRIAVQQAVLHNPDTLDPDVSRLPGRERAGGSAESGRPTSQSSQPQPSARDWASPRAPPTRSWPTRSTW